MKVYLLYNTDYEGYTRNRGVFSTKEKAELHRSVLQQYTHDTDETYYVREFEVKD